MLGWYSGNTASSLDYQCVSKDLNPGEKKMRQLLTERQKHCQLEHLLDEVVSRFCWS